MHSAAIDRTALCRPRGWRGLGLVVLAVVLHCAPLASAAQNMAHTVVTRALQFARGTSGAQVSGRADYATSHVYTLSARAGQTMTVDLQSPGDAVTFTAVAPVAGTLEEGFGVTHWQGVLPESGHYELVLVMNTESLRRVPYRLRVSVR